MAKGKDKTKAQPGTGHPAAYDMLDEPVANPRYGGVTLREAVIIELKSKKPKNPPSGKLQSDA